MQQSKIRLLVEIILGMNGRILDGSKSSRNIVYNANVIIGDKKVWYGDFSKQDCERLRLLSQFLEEPIYVLKEMDARFETENKPLIEKAIYKFGA